MSLPVPCSSRTALGLSAVVLAVCLFGDSKTAEATCGDYLLHAVSPESKAQQRDVELPSPSRAPRCFGGKCRQAPAQSPFESNTRLDELRWRIQGTYARAIAPESNLAADGMPVPQSDARPESADRLALDRPPEPARTA